MAGESIEDMSIDLMKASDSEIKRKCQFPEPNSSEAANAELQASISDQVIKSMLHDPQSNTEALRAEFR